MFFLDPPLSLLTGSRERADAEGKGVSSSWAIMAHYRSLMLYGSSFGSGCSFVSKLFSLQEKELTGTEAGVEVGDGSGKGGGGGGGGGSG